MEGQGGRGGGGGLGTKGKQQLIVCLKSCHSIARKNQFILYSIDL